MKLLPVLNRSLKALKPQPQDQAAVELARWYARALDEAPGMLITYGRLFRETLETLGMTPKARAKFTQEQPTELRASPIDELRKRRERRTS